MAKEAQVWPCLKYQEDVEKSTKMEQRYGNESSSRRHGVNPIFGFFRESYPADDTERDDTNTINYGIPKHHCQKHGFTSGGTVAFTSASSMLSDELNED